MDASVGQVMQLTTTWIDSETFARKPPGSLQFSRKFKEQKRLLMLVSAQFRPTSYENRHRSVSLEVSCSYENRRRSVSLEVSCSYKNSPTWTLESESFEAPFEDEKILKNKFQEIEPFLKGRSIYLVGMMGSGKTTVGKVLSGALDYSFVDSDSLVEKDTGGISVAEIFKLYGEHHFRDKETKALEKISELHRLVVSTGGGIVMEGKNWEYMKKGISVWLDVPLEELAQRIAAVGTDSRPLLHHESGDAYTKAFRRLSALFEQRHKAYAKATATVSLENIAVKLGDISISDITPVTIAIEALEQIENLL